MYIYYIYFVYFIIDKVFDSFNELAKVCGIGICLWSYSKLLDHRTITFLEDTRTSKQHKSFHNRFILRNLIATNIRRYQIQLLSIIITIRDYNCD